MKSNQDRIQYFEQLLKKQMQTVEQLEQALSEVSESFSAYQELEDYYYSEEREQDIQEYLEDESQTVEIEVLNEDSLYDLMEKYHDQCVCMLEIATKYFKR